ncbi:tight adherence protein B [Desulfobaculum xiamenense]|uniref:Tight adherence protein B n=1 Tax=Desulfobaculum xiamenense TaxID=995050 RepID=A0A846QJL2_9BACT|nr:type II secretion system F family protein [Desulfobaculum xiamenense]NJB67260.1 tight adherence protein B [Desulfobaculum xiamenense]
MLALIAFVSVIACFALAMGVCGLLFGRGNDAARRAHRRMQRLARSAPQDVDILRRRSLSDVPWLHRVLAGLSWTSRLETLIRQANVRVNVGVLVLVSATGATIGYLCAELVTDNFFFSFVPPVIFGYAPFFWVKRRRNKRMEKFQRQLPEALDLVARALKAGHAFTHGMRLVADEFEDPIGPEFAITLDEINFGIDMDQAMQNLVNRVDCPDLMFFVVSVNIQRETGGNLAEIIANISRLIRERFKLHGKIRVLSAEGRLTAYILLALPSCVGLVINIINPEYMSLLYETPEGKNVMTMAIFMMGIGAAALKKLIAIRV